MSCYSYHFTQISPYFTMDKWLKRARPNPPSRETPLASTSRPTTEDEPAGDSNPGCSYEFMDQGASSSASVASQSTSMATDSDSESDAEILPPDMRKHRETSSKRRKYDENYIALGFTCIGTGSSTRPQCVICAKVFSQLDETFTFAQTFGNQPFSLEK